LIIVDGALCSRAFGPSAKLAALLARHFTVYRYDRRGRGGSDDRPPYAVAREIDDLAALIGTAGSPVSLLGLSSGAALALEAAAGGLPIAAVVAYEPPYVHQADGHDGSAYEAALRRLIAAGDRAGAVKYFMKDMVNVPAAAVVAMRLMPWIWRKLVAVGHTLPYDAAVMGTFKVPATRFSSIHLPSLIMNGSKTDARLKVAAHAAVAAVPGARFRELAGQTHNVKADVLAPAVVEFVSAVAGAATRS
jgi:pimeloyl-ACP methyl ester carboxylesterase